MPGSLPPLLLILFLASISLAGYFYRKWKHARKSEAQLDQSRRSYETLAESSPVGIFHTDASGFTTYVNPRWCEITGMTATQGLGNGWLTAVHPDDRVALAAEWDRATKVEGGSVYVYRFVRKDGTIVWVQGEAVPELNGHGDLIGYVGTATDITERKLAEQMLVNERNLSDNIINSMPGIFYLLTKEGQNLRWNHNFEKVTEYDPEEIRRLHPLDLFDGTEKQLISKAMDNVFEFGEDQVQACLRTRSGKLIPYYLTGKSIEYEGRSCLLGVGIDFTERVEAQERIRETGNQLRELAAHLQNIREQERSEIARDIHDDLGQQLTAIKMDLSRLAKRVAASPEIVVRIREITDMIGTGIESIRRISRQLRPSILDDLGLEEAMKWQIGEFEKRYAIKIEAQFTNIPSLIQTPVATNLFRIFQETLTNVARHAGATIVQIRLEADNKEIRLTVEDDGRGLDADKIKGKRTLGLLGMQERAIMVGGRLEIDGFTAKGTRIRVNIPTNAPSLPLQSGDR
ncbi:MAG TPA: PAS domain S-box protein [Puia sp.]|nr:PAS domain S-box protein [Puia sp.]